MKLNELKDALKKNMNNLERPLRILRNINYNNFILKNELTD